RSVMAFARLRPARNALARDAHYRRPHTTTWLCSSALVQPRLAGDQGRCSRTATTALGKEFQSTGRGPMAAPLVALVDVDAAARINEAEIAGARVAVVALSVISAFARGIVIRTVVGRTRGHDAVGQVWVATIAIYGALGAAPVGVVLTGVSGWVAPVGRARVLIVTVRVVGALAPRSNVLALIGRRITELRRALDTILTIFVLRALALVQVARTLADNA